MRVGVRPVNIETIFVSITNIVSNIYRNINKFLPNTIIYFIRETYAKLVKLFTYTLSGSTGSALTWRSEGRRFASQSVQ